MYIKKNGLGIFSTKTENEKNVLYKETKGRVSIMKRGISRRKFIYNVILYGCIRLKVREKIARGVALALTAALVVTGVDFAVFAAAGSDGRKEKGVITAFADLDASVTMQSLPVGAEVKSIFLKP